MKRSEEFKSLLSSVPEPHVWGPEYVRGKYMLMCALESEGSLECCGVAREILDKFGYGVVVPENIVLGCYDCLARHGDFESYMIALEWNRPMEKKFYLPRAKVLKRHGVIEAFQELQDGLLDLLVLETPPRVGKSTLSLMFITMRAALYPDDSILGNGHSSALTRSFYNEFLNLVTSDEYRFSEIFPNISISNKNAEDNYVDFNNDKRFHTAMFKSVDGGTTGLAEASNLLYCDDMVKDVETANSKDRLDKLYYNYTSSIKDRKVSRLRKDGKYHSAPELWVATPWSIYDPMSRVIANELERNNESRVKIVAIPCWDENHNSNFMYDYGKGFDTRYYEEMQLAEDPVIFSAKYLMKPIERDGRPFERDSLTYFTELPVDDDGNIKKPDRIIAYNDVSHGGDDFMSMPIAYVYGRDVYIVDVLFMHKFNGDAYSRPLVCKKLIDNKVQSCGFEKNNGGDFYESLIHNDLVNMNYRCNTIAFNAPTTKSKLDRILSCQADIHGDSPIEDFYRVMFRNPKSIPVNSEYMAFLNNIWNWSQKEGRTQKRQHDDGVDSVAGLLINMLGKHMRGGYNIYDIRDAGY